MSTLSTLSLDYSAMGVSISTDMEGVTGVGMGRPVRFETDGDGVTRYFERSRFEAV